jgi:putative thioredoxin
MMSSDHIIQVNENDFEYEVLSYSQNTPVVVYFWAEWCKPCKLLGPMLEALAYEANGAFRLAKLDVDNNPNLAVQYGVRSLPTVKAFSEGEVVSEFVGAQPNQRVRDFLSRLAPPSQTSLLEEKAGGYLSLRQWAKAEAAFREVLDQNPEHPAALLGLSKALLAQGEGREALYTLKAFPASSLYASAQRLLPLAEAVTAQADETLPAENDLDAAFAGAVRLASRGSFLPAMDGLLDILRQNRHYRGDKARQLFLAILEMLDSDDSDARQYRAELASVLF